MNTITEFVNWLEKNHKIDISEQAEQYIDMKKNRICATLTTRRVCEFLKIDEDKAMSSSRKRELVECRYIIMAALRNEGLGASEIGRKMGRDHSTILHGFEAYESFYQTDSKFRRKADETKTYLEN